jgi:hypothetical protein
MSCVTAGDCSIVDKFISPVALAFDLLLKKRSTNLDAVSIWSLFKLGDK